MDALVSTSPAVQLTHLGGFRFRVRFREPGARDLVTDEPMPLGAGTGPNPTEMLAAAVGNCLSSSLLYCSEKAHIDVVGLETNVEVEMRRNEQGRLRIGSIRVRLEPEADLEAHRRMQRCIGLYESFCTVTDSIRHGIDVQVEIVPQVTTEVTGHADIGHRSAPTKLAS